MIATMNGEAVYVPPGGLATKETHIKIPSNKFVFIDHFDSRSFSMGSWVFNYTDHLFFDEVAVWHPKKAAFSYADGHAKFYKWQDNRTYWYAKTTVYNLPSTDPEYMDNASASADNVDVDFLANGYRVR